MRWTPRRAGYAREAVGVPAQPDAGRLHDGAAAVLLVQGDLIGGRLLVVQSKVVQVREVVVADVPEDVHAYRRVVDLAREGVFWGLADVREVGKDVLVRVGDPKRFRVKGRTGPSTV